MTGTGTKTTRTAGAGGFSYTAEDEEKRRGVRRMKATATALLLLVAVVYALATWAEASGVTGWPAYVAAAAEAGMVGALADWFAVTALFRRPMGLPIPHTAIIPTKKDQLGESLGTFVGENFLSADVVRARLHALDIAGRLGAWLSEPAHADRVTAELSTALRGALTVLRDADVRPSSARRSPAGRRRRRSRPASARPSAGSSPTGRTTGRSTWSAPAPTTGWSRTATR